MAYEVRRYSKEESKERILRYLKKINQRNFKKTIKYACRKIVADRRVRGYMIIPLSLTFSSLCNRQGLDDLNSLFQWPPSQKMKTA
ncbi:hypothetical protein P8452_18780 [Trifolium repens]|nr:hypothetical protein P8452_18780 [Trifolium repens]